MCLQQTALPAIQSRSGPFLIREVVRRWDDHLIMRKWMYDFFRYLDRFYVKRHGKKALNEVAISRFRTLVFDKIKQKLTLAILDAIKKDRNGEEVDRGMLHKAIGIYVELGLGSYRLYQSEFERSFLESSREYYQRLSSSWVTLDSCPEYIKKSEMRFREEKKRVQDYLVPSTEGALLRTLNDTLLMAHQRELLEKENTGVRALLKSRADADLARIYALYSAIPTSLPFIAQMLQAHIIELGLSLLAANSSGESGAPPAAGASAAAAPSAAATSSSAAPAPSAPKSNYIEELMSIHDLYFELVRNCFQGNSTFQRALKEAFEHIINKAHYESASAAELLATYSDDVLRKGGLAIEGAQLDKTLDSIVRLFSYLIDKDLFNEFYRKQLATRLLTQRSASSDAEKSMIGKLKLIMGAQFTSKLEGMFNDMRNAAEHQAEFQNFLVQRAVDLGGMEFTVQTLTQGFWPSYPLDELRLPSVMAKPLDTFRAFYDTRTNNRRLRWIHELGIVNLSGAFTKRKLELVVSTIQATVLLQFNEAEELSIQALTDLTGLDADTVKQTLKSLASGKSKVLLKTPEQGYNVSHRIRVNHAFTSPAIRVRLPAPVRKTTPKERENAALNVAEDRKHAMEANIVRIMKSRKTMNHTNLMTEARHTKPTFAQSSLRSLSTALFSLHSSHSFALVCCSQVSAQLMKYFQPDPRAIKQRIEDLIQREYMKRDDEQTSLYHYLA